MRLSVLCLTVTSFLAACSGYAPPANLSGLTADQLVAQMGPPETRRPVEGGGTRLEFPRGPYGQHTWFVYLDATGRVVRSEQVLTERHFTQINPGMGQDDVRSVLGRPGEVDTLGRSRGVVWNYRYENPFCRWFQVEISQDRQVRSAGYGEPPECRRRDIAPFQ
jgi:hypothetical protein